MADIDKEYWDTVAETTEHVAKRLGVSRESALMAVMLESVAAHLADVEVAIMWTVEDDEDEPWKNKDEDDADDDSSSPG